MDVKLVVLGGKHPGQVIAVHGSEFLVGRAPECKLRPNSDMVSRRHCIISIAEGRATIRDLGSRNGTIVNGAKITGEHELRTGEKIKIGPLEFEVQLSTSVSGKKKPKVHNVQEAAARTVEAANPRDSERDIDDWLNEEETEGDTKNIKMSTTTFVPPAIAKPTEATPAASGQQQRIDPLAGPGQVKKPMAESSRVAAADMLKQFFQPRRP
ncbi:MAG: FHA domain-containing protein [Thermoguttaceae bacterium]|jgi:predicted component of type VI protein secretion system